MKTDKCPDCGKDDPCQDCYECGRKAPITRGVIRKAIAVRIGDPKEVIKLAEKRVLSLIHHHWATQGNFSVSHLAQSCYMQGLDDAFESLRERVPEIKKEVSTIQIAAELSRSTYWYLAWARVALTPSITNRGDGSRARRFWKKVQDFAENRKLLARQRMLRAETPNRPIAPPTPAPSATP